MLVIGRRRRVDFGPEHHVFGFAASDRCLPGPPETDPRMQLPKASLSGDCIVMRSRHTGVNKPTRVSLAQFSKNLISSKSPDRPVSCLGGTEDAAQVGAEKRLAAKVVAAMSNPALGSSEDVAESLQNDFPPWHNRPYPA
jgi:hypothetical protein